MDPKDAALTTGNAPNDHTAYTPDQLKQAPTREDTQECEEEEKTEDANNGEGTDQQ